MSRHSKHGKPRKSVIDSIRKPVPKSGFAFKSRHREMREAELDAEVEDATSLDEEDSYYRRKRK